MGSTRVRRAEPTRPLRPVATHFRACPLPEPPRYRHVSRVARPPTDRLGMILEQWLAELRGGYTIAGD